MKKLVLLMLLVILAGITLQAQARSFRSIQPIAQPGPVPAGATPITAVQPIDRALVEQAVNDVARAWNSGELSGLLADDFASRSRLLDTIAEVVPRDATLTILGIQAVSTLEQYRDAEGTLVSTVSAVVRSQIEYNDPVSGYRRLEGIGEWLFRVTQTELRPSEPSLPATAGPSGPVMGQTSATDGTRMFIADVNPPSPRWDQTLTISGGNFGDGEGTAWVRLRDSGQLLLFRVLSWSDDRITAVIDESAFGLLPGAGLGAEPLTGVLWLEDVGGRNRAGKELAFHAPMSSDLPAGASAGDADNPHIEGVFPPAPRWDGSVTIRGDNFGRSPGLPILFHPDGSRQILLEVDSWSDTAIVAHIRQTDPGNDLRDVVPEWPDYGPGPTPALLKIVNTHTMKQATRQLNFMPSPLLMTPVLTSFSGLQENGVPHFSPGATVRLSGRNFLSTPGSVVFHLGRTDIPAEISDWSDENIFINLPESLEGLIDQGGWLTLNNRLGFAADFDLLFFARKVTTSIEGRFSMECRGPDHPATATVLYHPLLNTWRVADGLASIHVTAAYDYRPPGESHVLPTYFVVASELDDSCRFTARPAPGSFDPTTELECSCEGFGRDGRIDGKVLLPVTGPAGTSHGHIDAVR